MSNPTPRKTLSDEKKAQYLGGSTNCPYCDSPKIAGGAMSEDELTVTRQVIKCRGCGRQWTDVYTLTSIVEESDDVKPEADPGGG